MGERGVKGNRVRERWGSPRGMGAQACRTAAAAAAAADCLPMQPLAAGAGSTPSELRPADRASAVITIISNNERTSPIWPAISVMAWSRSSITASLNCSAPSTDSSSCCRAASSSACRSCASRAAADCCFWAAAAAAPRAAGWRGRLAASLVLAASISRSQDLSRLWKSRSSFCAADESRAGCCAARCLNSAAKALSRWLPSATRRRRSAVSAGPPRRPTSSRRRLNAVTARNWMPLSSALAAAAGSAGAPAAGGAPPPPPPTLPSSRPPPCRVGGSQQSSIGPESR